MERPTVPIAEVVSNKISRNPADSITETAIVPIIKIVKDISITEIPVRIFSSGILLPKHSVSLFPFTTVTAVRNNIAIVVVFTPPAVPAGEPPIKTEVIEYRLPDGSISLREIPYPAWVEPEAAGQTPMCEALRRVRDIAAAWCADPAHAESFPPMVFNITDGEATDCDDAELRAVAGQIKSLRTADGNVLLVNIHIAAGDTPRTVFFPSAEEASYPNRYAEVLYDCSSPMPEVFNEAIREAKGPGALPPFRGMSFNASAEELITMLNIGSISVKTE